MPERKTKKGKSHCTRTVLRIPDLEQSKDGCSQFTSRKTSQESYAHAIDEFIAWYCSEPRLAFNRPVVLRYRIYLEQRNLASSTINVRLAAVRRLAYEAADTGLLSPELAAGIRRVKGAKRLGVRIGIGSLRSRAKRCCRVRVQTPCGANGTVRFSPCYSGADSGVQSSLLWACKTCRFGKTTGCSRT